MHVIYTLLCGLIILYTEGLSSPATFHASIYHPGHRPPHSSCQPHACLAGFCMLLALVGMSSTLLWLSKVLSILQDEAPVLILMKLFAAILTHS